MSVSEKLSHALVRFARRRLRNTWVHRISITSKVYHLLVRLTTPEEERQINFKNKKIWVNTKDTSMVPSIMAGDYEAYELEVFLSQIKPKMTVLDVGANIGIYSVLANDKTSRIFAFEPIPENLSLLRKNVAANQAKSVTVVPTAIGAKTGQIDISVVPGSLGTHGVFAKSDQRLTVKVQTIDDFVKKKRLKVGLIKMDIEGYEPYAISGGKLTLKSQVPVLLMEFNCKLINKSGVDPLEFSKELTSIYKYTYLINERRKRLDPISAREISKLINENILLADHQISLSSSN